MSDLKIHAAVWRQAGAELNDAAEVSKARGNVALAAVMEALGYLATIVGDNYGETARQPPAAPVATLWSFACAPGGVAIAAHLDAAPARLTVEGGAIVCVPLTAGNAPPPSGRFGPPAPVPPDRPYPRPPADPDAGWRDDSYPPRDCDRCGKSYRGPPVYCSLKCALDDA